MAFGTERNSGTWLGERGSRAIAKFIRRGRLRTGDNEETPTTKAHLSLVQHSGYPRASFVERISNEKLRIIVLPGVPMPPIAAFLCRSELSQVLVIIKSLLQVVCLVEKSYSRAFTF